MSADRIKDGFRNGREDSTTVQAAETPAPVDLEIAWAKQASEIKRLLAEKGELERVVQNYETELNALTAEMRIANKAKNVLEPKLAKAENELVKKTCETDKLVELNNELRSRAERLREEASDGRREVEELTRVNTKLLVELESSIRQMERKDKTINEFKKEIVGMAEKELRYRFLEAEAERLKEEMSRMQGDMESMLEQQRELESELLQDDSPAVPEINEEEMSRSWASLEEQIHGGEVRNEDEIDEIAYSSAATQTISTENNDNNNWRVSDIITLGRIPEAVEAATHADGPPKATLLGVLSEPSSPSLDARWDQHDEQKRPELPSSYDPQAGVHVIPNEDVRETCFYVGRWVMLVFCAIFWYELCQAEKQRWMQANDSSRRVVIDLRDEKWFQPIWMLRLVFTTEMLLQIDRLPFA